MAERLATICVLPLLLAGVLGAPSKREQLAEYLKNLLVEGTVKETQSTTCNAEIVDAVRFLWFVTFQRLCTSCLQFHCLLNSIIS